MSITCVAVIASVVLGAANEPQSVRADDVRLVSMIEAGARCSPTFASIVERLRSANIVVYVQFGRCGARIEGCLGYVTWAAPFLYVRATVNPFEKPEHAIVGLIAHELQHASELDHSEVRTREQFEAFFARHGRRGSAGYETDAAAAAGIRVEHEYESAARRSPMLVFSECLAALLSGAPESSVSALSEECLVGVDARGALVFAEPGETDRVEVPHGIEGILQDPAASITLRHNHPHSQGLSKGDVLTLGMAGVSVIEAIGRDGSVYSAARGPHFDIARVARVYRKTTELLAMYFTLDALPADEGVRLRAQADHLACVALAEAGVIKYTGRLSPGQGALLDRHAARVSLVRRWATAEAGGPDHR